MTAVTSMTTYKFQYSRYRIDIKPSRCVAMTKAVVNFAYDWILSNKAFYSVGSISICRLICSAGGFCSGLACKLIQQLTSSLQSVCCSLCKALLLVSWRWNLERATSPRVLSILSFSLRERLSDMTSVILLLRLNNYN